MIAAIPFFEMRMVDEGIRVTFDTLRFVIPTFGVPIDPWATLVCLGVLLGLEVSRHRAMKMGFEPREIVDGVVFTVLVGFFFAHVITVVGYYPERLRTEGIWAILKVWEGFSSTGGFLGGIGAIWIFYTWIRPHDVMRFADLIAYGYPVGWLFGRAGCAVVHDHVGVETTFPLAMRFPANHFAAGVRHELGFYEFVLMIPMIAFFWWLGRKDRPPGTFMGLFFVLYSPIRFGLDFLRQTDLEHHDVRWAGLTAAQYGMVALFAFGAWLMWRAHARRDFQPWPLDGSADQEARSQAGTLGTPAPTETADA
ncbi:MAG: prolipoprotein diacylglyceryl transferase [Alphaproteobacteria bacterium]|nr:prolipoprotein diacylglyceryl transferase [Alphaproteobacteria bacterium]